MTAPRTRKCKPNNVLPQPAPPQRSVGRPAGNPPPVISSSPGMPVGVFFKTGSSAFVGSLLREVERALLGGIGPVHSTLVGKKDFPTRFMTVPRPALAPSLQRWALNR